MDIKDISSGARERMGKAIEALESNLSILRTGRANPGILKKIVVDYHGTPMPIDQPTSPRPTRARSTSSRGIGRRCR